MRSIIILCTVSLLIPVGESWSQNQSAEFIESSSPLPGGGKVVSRSTPGSGMQTATENPLTNESNVSPNSILNSDSDKQTQPTNARNSVFKQSSVAPQNFVQAVAPRYAYPATSALSNNNRGSQTALFYQPVRATATCNNCAVPYQIPTLGLTNTVRTGRQVYGQNNCCGPGYAGTNTVLQVPAAQVPTLQIQPPANQIPSFTVPNAGQAAIQPAPNIGVPQFNTQSNRFLNPFVTGSGAYQPIIRISNVPPGTYVGQGIIGQPVAYVDGQPVRNLLRYVFP